MSIGCFYEPGTRALCWGYKDRQGDSQGGDRPMSRSTHHNTFPPWHVEREPQNKGPCEPQGEEVGPLMQNATVPTGAFVPVKDRSPFLRYFTSIYQNIVLILLDQNPLCHLPENCHNEYRTLQRVCEWHPLRAELLCSMQPSQLDMCQFCVTEPRHPSWRGEHIMSRSDWKSRLTLLHPGFSFLYDPVLNSFLWKESYFDLCFKAWSYSSRQILLMNV